ncbi:MAG: TolC family protein [Halioglobus sp.]
MSQVKAALVTVCSALLLQACTTLGPDYEEPPVDWLQEWQTDLYGQYEPASAARADLDFWWKAFNDPVLTGLIETAKRENPGIRIAALAIVQSRALLGVATGSQYPQVQKLEGAYARNDTWPTEGDNSGNNTNFNTYGAGATIAWELDFWGRWQRTVESADAGFYASLTNQQNVQVLLSAQVAQSYFSWRTIKRQIEIARENASLQQRSFEITSRLFERGQSSELDLQQARNQYLTTLASIPALEISLRQVENALSVLLGRYPGNLPELAGLDAELPVLDAVMIDEIPASLLMRRPDIRTSAWRVAAQSAQIGVAKADLYPSISLLGTVGWSGSSVNGTTNSLASSVGPSFSWKVLNYGRIKNAVRVQDALLQQAIEGYQATVLQAAQEIDSAAIGVVKTQEQKAILAESLEAAQRSLELATKRYQEGYSDFQRVLDAQRALAAASNSYVSNQGAHVGAVVAFYKALGGGWQPVSGEELIPAATRQQMEARTDWNDMLVAPLPDVDSKP